MTVVKSYGTKKMNDDIHATGATPGDDESDLFLDSLATPEMRNAAELEAIARAYDTHIFGARRKAGGSDWLIGQYIL